MGKRPPQRPPRRACRAAAGAPPIRARLASAAAALILAAGCAAPRTQIATKADEETPRAVESMVVVSHLARIEPEWADAFALSLHELLKDRPVRSAIQTRDPIAVRSDRDRYSRQIEAFAPVAVLVIEPGEGTVDNRGRHFQRTFEAGLFRYPTSRDRPEIIWRASIVLQPAGLFLAEDDLPALARDLVAAMEADGILAGPGRRAARETP